MWILRFRSTHPYIPPAENLTEVGGQLVITVNYLVSLFRHHVRGVRSARIGDSYTAKIVLQKCPNSNEHFVDLRRGQQY
jgi:hypothetical protein